MLRSRECALTACYVVRVYALPACLCFGPLRLLCMRMAVDFGAACDLFSRTNYDPTLQVFDPKFGPPEAPPAQGGLVPGAGGRFDVFSAALLIIQMCFKGVCARMHMHVSGRAVRLGSDGR